jgi:hypothetical protein
MAQTTTKKSVTKSDVKAGKPDVRVVTVDTAEEDIVKWDQEGFELKFDPTSFLPLKDEITEEFRHGNKRNYFVAEAHYKEREKSEEGKEAETSTFGILDPLAGSEEYRLATRKRRGWVPCWKAPWEFDAALRLGYKQIREPDEKQLDGEPYEPGQERGAVKKIGRVRDEHGEMDCELIAMEIPYEVHQAHLEAVAAKSQVAKGAIKEQFKETVRRAKMVPYDEEELVQKGVDPKDIDKGFQ